MEQARGPDKQQLNALMNLYQQGKLHDALTLGRALSGQFPEVPFLYNLLGAVLNEMGRNQEALESFHRALALKPDYADAYCNLGISLDGLGRHQEAVASYQRAIDINPNHIAPYNNLGIALTNLGRYQAAIASLQKALALNPNQGDAHYNCGNALMRLGRHEEAAISFRRACDIDPGHVSARCNWLNELAHTCDLEQLKAVLKRELPALEFGTTAREVASPFVLLALSDDPGLHLRAAQAYAEVHHPFDTTLGPLVGRHRGHSERIRIGYFSADFHNHATMYLMAELFEHHDRSRFEVHAFSFGPDRDDDMRARLRNGVERFHDVRQKGHADIAALARDAGIDIAIDLKGYTQYARPDIFAHRAAPIQVSYLGYPGTMGAPYIDYIIADRVVIPEENRHFFTEKVAYLPDCYQVNDSHRNISPRPTSRPDHGLPENGFVFCCFNNSYKIMAEEFDIWMRLLDQVDGAVLWLLKTDPTAQHNLCRAAETRGISPERLVFAERLPLAEHLARQQLADLFLDTFIYNAHTTASDALWAGLPVLTRLGQSFASRVAGTLLTAGGLTELITTSAADYEATALRLATRPEELRTLRDRLERKRMTTSLFDSQRFTRNIEAAYSRMIRRFDDGLAPDHFFIGNGDDD